MLSLIAFGAIGSVPQSPDDMPHVVHISEALLLPDLDMQIAQLHNLSHTYIAEDRMRAGDTLAALLVRLGVDDNQASEFLRKNRAAAPLLRMPNNTVVQSETDATGRLLTLRAPLGQNSDDLTGVNLVVSRSGDGFTAGVQRDTVETRIEMRSGNITSSLFGSTDAADIPDAITAQLVTMFGTKINFLSDLRKGDHFNVAYETLWQNGRQLRTGRILAGEFINKGKPYRAVWFEGNQNVAGGYYDIDGSPLAKAFLKSPLKYTRISSGFSMRKHPILGIWKQHTGTDFAAPMGTPIHATSDGVIAFEGAQSGYGNVIFLKHDATYTSIYGHMSRFASGLHQGSTVKQGDVIGYVGMTGWATGPHVHYEIRVNDQPRDAMTIALPGQPPLAKNELKLFLPVAGEIRHRFALLDGVRTSTIQVAQNDPH